MITAVLCPHPPLLLRELTGIDDPGAELREACVLALKSALGSSPETVHLVGADDPRGPWEPGGEVLSLTVGDRLLDLAGWTGARVRHVPPFDSVSPEEGSVFLFLGDGSARRGEKAPGHLDERAARFDAVVDDALRHGRADVLAGLDEHLGRDLMAAGVPAFRALGELGERRGVRSAEVRYADDPLGVFYWVVTWEFGSDEGDG